MRLSTSLLAPAIALLTCGASPSHASANGADLEWAYHAVGTPYLPGEPKIGKPGFVPPMPIVVKLPQHVPCAPKDALGEYEAFVSEQGRVTSVSSHHDPAGGNRCQRKYIFPAIRRWRLQPATFEGRPTPVYMWIGVNGR